MSVSSKKIIMDCTIQFANTDYIGRMNLLDIQADLHCFGLSYPSSGLGAEFLRTRISEQEAFIALSPYDELYGFAVIEVLKDHHYCYLHQISVAPEQQRQGIGFSFLEEIFQDAKKKGVEKMGLVTTLNAPWGVNLYQKFGFRESEVRQQNKALQNYLQNQLGYRPETKGYFEMSCEETK